MEISAKKVLIVEDEEPMRKILHDEFEREGFVVFAEENRERGLDTALKEKPDIILLDIVMPEMDGLTMLKELRKDSWGKNAKVVLLTNYSDIDKISEAVQIGISGYLVKSDWKLGDVIKKVKEKLLSVENS